MLTKKKEVKLTQHITKGHVTVNVFAYIQLTKKITKKKKKSYHTLLKQSIMRTCKLLACDFGGEQNCNNYSNSLDIIHSLRSIGSIRKPFHVCAG